MFQTPPALSSLHSCRFFYPPCSMLCTIIIIIFIVLLYYHASIKMHQKMASISHFSLFLHFPPFFSSNHPVKCYPGKTGNYQNWKKKKIKKKKKVIPYQFWKVMLPYLIDFAATLLIGSLLANYNKRQKQNKKRNKNKFKCVVELQCFKVFWT